MRLLFLLAMVAGLQCFQASAAEREEIVLELGPATERDVKSGSTRSGATVAIETTPIEHWLEIEYGLTLFAPRRQQGLEADVLFKKPFRLSDTVEFMAGAGPVLERRLGGGGRASSYGIEFVLDFMFWPSKQIGWYIEPSYSLGLGATKGEKTLGASGGLLLRFD